MVVTICPSLAAIGAQVHFISTGSSGAKAETGRPETVPEDPEESRQGAEPSVCVKQVDGGKGVPFGVRLNIPPWVRSCIAGGLN